MATVTVSEFNILITSVCDVYGRPIYGDDNNLDYDGCNDDVFEALSDASNLFKKACAMYLKVFTPSSTHMQ